MLVFVTTIFPVNFMFTGRLIVRNLTFAFVFSIHCILLGTVWYTFMTLLPFHGKYRHYPKHIQVCPLTRFFDLTQSAAISVFGAFRIQIIDLT